MGRRSGDELVISFQEHGPAGMVRAGRPPKEARRVPRSSWRSGDKTRKAGRGAASPHLRSAIGVGRSPFWAGQTAKCRGSTA